MYNYLREALKIAFNRSATQLASIIIIAFLGGASTELLASFSLTLSAAAIFFVATSALQYGILAELSKSFGEKNQKDLFGVFFAGLWFMLGISSASLALAYMLPNPFSGIATSSISLESFSAYKTLVISLPVVAISSAFQYLLEAHQKISLVFKLKITTVSIQLTGVVLVICYKQNITANDIAISYLITDIIGLLLSVTFCLLNIDRLSFKKSAMASFEFLKRRQDYVRAIVAGGPVLLGAVSQKYLFYYMSIHLANLGAASASAFAILNSVIFLIMIPITGVAHLATIKISYAAGSKDLAMLINIQKSIKDSFLITSSIIGLASWFLLPWIASIFSQDDLVKENISGLGYVFFAFYLLNCFLSVFMGVLRGLSDTLYPQLYANLTLFVVMVPTLILNPSIDLYKVISVFCLVGFTVVIGLTMRCNNKLRIVTDVCRV